MEACRGVGRRARAAAFALDAAFLASSASVALTIASRSAVDMLLRQAAASATAPQSMGMPSKSAHGPSPPPLLASSRLSPSAAIALRSSACTCSTVLKARRWRPSMARAPARRVLLAEAAIARVDAQQIDRT